LTLTDIKRVVGTITTLGKRERRQDQKGELKPGGD